MAEPVKASGSHSAKWAILGEAPGYWEDQKGQPFVGKSGQLLRDNLIKVGLEPKRAYITNVIKERPPDNKTPTAKEIKAALPALAEELNALPNLEAVLVVGGTALRAISGLTAITKHRGLLKTPRDEMSGLSGVTFFATLHPAAVLRNRNHEPSFLQDLAAFAQLVTPPPPAGEVILVDTQALLEEFSCEFWGAHRGALDIETTVEDRISDAKLVSIAVTFDGKRAWVIPVDHPESPPEMETRLEGWWEKVDWIMHNGSFDRLMLKQFGIDAKLTHDTMAMAYLLNENERKSLEILSSVYLGLPPYKGVDYMNIMDEPLAKIAQMNGEDVLRTYNLYRPLANELNKNVQLNKLYQWLLMPAINCLIETTSNGVPLDMGRLVPFSKTIHAREQELRELLMGAAPEAFPGDYNPNSSQQTAVILYELFDLPILETTEKGAPSTSSDVRSRLREEAQGEALEFLKLLDEYKNLNTRIKHVEGWVKLADDNGYLHPRYKPLHVVTGRLSSQGPNIQNVPREPAYRRLFGGVSDSLWMKADLSQIELRLAAWLAGEQKMLAAYQDGEDLHSKTALAILGKDTPLARQTGKTLNFGLIYGAGPATLERIARQQYGVVLEPGQAREYRDRFFNLYPGLAAWHHHMWEVIQSEGVSVSPLGRIRHLPDATYTGQDEQLKGLKFKAVREGINHPVQSFASDILLYSMTSLAEKGLGPYMVAEVHDEIDLVVPSRMAGEVAKEVKATMENTDWLLKWGIDLNVPLLAEVTVGTHWSNE